MNGVRSQILVDGANMCGTQGSAGGVSVAETDKLCINCFSNNQIVSPFEIAEVGRLAS